MKSKTAWEDLYAVGSMNYVHSNSKYFENILNKSTVLGDFKDTSFTRALFNIILLVLEDHLSFWKKMADLAISKAKEEKLYIASESISHEKFLEDLNNAYERLKEANSALGALYTYNDLKIKTTTRTEEAKVEMIKNVKVLYESIAALYNVETTLVSPFFNYLKNSGITNFKSMSEIAPNLAGIKEKINSAINILGAKDLKGLKNMIDNFNVEELDPSKNPDFNKIFDFFTVFTRQQIKQFLTTGWMGGTQPDIPQFAGKYLEDIINITFSQDKFAGKLMGLKNFVPDLGKDLAKVSIIDKVVIVGEYDKKQLNLGTGIKLKESTDLTKRYELETDIVHTNYLKSFLGQHRALSQNSIDILKWLRVNFQSLNIFSNDEKLKNSIIDKFVDLEKRIAGLTILPRFLDGVYEYQTEKLSLPETGGQLYHTSFLIMDGKIYWTYKFLEQIIEDIKQNLGDTSKTTTFSTLSSESEINLKKINVVELENLYWQKIQAMKDLDKVSYALLQKSPNVKPIIENLYLSSLSHTPVKSINTAMKFKKMIQNMGGNNE